jgi:drug/metabolite transporter (DMT)-like permease
VETQPADGDIGGFAPGPYGALAVTIVLWASAFAGIRVALVAYTPGQLAALRFAVASIALVAYAATGRLRRPSQRDLPRLIALGAVGIAAYNLALNAGELAVSAGAAGFLVNTVPVFTALLAVTVLGEHLAWQGWTGIGVSCIGAALIASGDTSESGGLRIGPGAALVILAAGCQSVFFVLQKRLLITYRPLDLTIYAIWSGTLFLTPFLPGALTRTREAPSSATVAAVYLGLFPGVLAYVAYAHALSRLPVARATSFLYLVPVVALPVAWAWLGEVPTLLTLGGGALILAGVVVVNRWGRA